MKKIIEESKYPDSKFFKQYYENEAEFYGPKKEVMYAKKMHFQRRLWEERIKCIRKNILSCQRFLDVGCAEGYYFKAITELFGSDTFCAGLDISETYLKRAKAVEKGEFVLADAQFLPFKDSSFDLVMSSEVMEHLPNPLVAFREALRVSSKYLIITTPRRSLFRRIYDAIGFSKDPFSYRSGHISEVDFSDILEGAKNHGAHVIEAKWDCYLPNGLINLLHLPNFFVEIINRIWSKILYFNKEFPILQIYVIAKR